MSVRHLLDIDDLDVDDLRKIVEFGLDPDKTAQPLAGQGVACIFEKPSTRTRNSTEMAVRQLGGHPIYITGEEIGIDTRESASDITRTLACYHRVICARVYDHHVLEKMASVGELPIVNLLSDRAHPLQAIADVMTIQAELGSVEDKTVTYIGDTNNVAVSLALAVGMLGGRVRLASPSGYQIGEQDQERLVAAGAEPTTFTDTKKAASGSDVIYTDTWISMGQEQEKERRLADLAAFQVDDAVMAECPDAIVMHCLPAHRGEEVSASVLDGPQSKIWVQAAYRQNAAVGVLSWLLEGATNGDR